jgi:hypothetical protein
MPRDTGNKKPSDLDQQNQHESLPTEDYAQFEKRFMIRGELNTEIRSALRSFANRDGVREHYNKVFDKILNKHFESFMEQLWHTQKYKIDSKQLSYLDTQQKESIQAPGVLPYAAVKNKGNPYIPYDIPPTDIMSFLPIETNIADLPEIHKEFAFLDDDNRNKAFARLATYDKYLQAVINYHEKAFSPPEPIVVKVPIVVYKEKHVRKGEISTGVDNQSYTAKIPVSFPSIPSLQTCMQALPDHGDQVGLEILSSKELRTKASKLKGFWENFSPEVNTQVILYKAKEELEKYAAHLAKASKSKNDTVLPQKINAVNSLLEKIKANDLSGFTQEWAAQSTILEMHRPKSLGGFKFNFTSSKTFEGKKVVSNINELLQDRNIIAALIKDRTPKR